MGAGQVLQQLHTTWTVNFVLNLVLSTLSIYLQKWSTSPNLIQTCNLVLSTILYILKEDQQHQILDKLYRPDGRLH